MQSFLFCLCAVGLQQRRKSLRGALCGVPLTLRRTVQRNRKMNEIIEKFDVKEVNSLLFKQVE